MSFDPEHPGVPDITTGFSLLLKARFSNTPALLERYAEILETQQGKVALALIMRGAERLERDGANAAFYIRFVAESIRSSLADPIAAQPEGSEWPDPTQESDGEMGVILDLRSRTRLN